MITSLKTSLKTSKASHSTFFNASFRASLAVFITVLALSGVVTSCSSSSDPTPAPPKPKPSVRLAKSAAGITSFEVKTGDYLDTLTIVADTLDSLIATATLVNGTDSGASLMQQNLQLKWGAGNVLTSEYPLSAPAFSGDVNMTVQAPAGMMFTIDGGNQPVLISGMKFQMSITNDDGNVTVKLPPNTNVTLDATAITGVIDVDYAGVKIKQTGGNVTKPLGTLGGPQVLIRAKKGNITIR